MVRVNVQPGKFGAPTRSFLDRQGVNQAVNEAVRSEEQSTAELRKRLTEQRANDSITRLKDEIQAARSRAANARSEEFREQQLFVADELGKLLDRARTGNFEPSELVRFANQRADARLGRIQDRREKGLSTGRVFSNQELRTLIENQRRSQNIPQGAIASTPDGFLFAPQNQSFPGAIPEDLIVEGRPISTPQGTAFATSPILSTADQDAIDEQREQIQSFASPSDFPKPLSFTDKLDRLFTNIDSSFERASQGREKKVKRGEGVRKIGSKISGGLNRFADFADPAEAQRRRVERELLEGRETEITTLLNDIARQQSIIVNGDQRGNQVNKKQLEISNKVLTQRISDAEKNAANIEKTLQKFDEERNLGKNPSGIPGTFNRDIITSPIIFASFGKELITKPVSTVTSIPGSILKGVTTDPVRFTVESGALISTLKVESASLKPLKTKTKTRINIQRQALKDIGDLSANKNFGILNKKTKGLTKADELKELKFFGRQLNKIEDARITKQAKTMLELSLIEEALKLTRKKKKSAPSFKIEEISGQKAISTKPKEFTKAELNKLENALTKKLTTLKRSLKDENVFGDRNIKKTKAKKPKKGILEDGVFKINLKPSSELVRGFDLTPKPKKKTSQVKKGSKKKPTKGEKRFSDNQLKILRRELTFDELERKGKAAKTKKELRTLEQISKAINKKVLTLEQKQEISNAIKKSKKKRQKELQTRKEIKVQFTSDKKVDFKTAGELKKEGLFPNAFKELKKPEIKLTKNFRIIPQPSRFTKKQRKQKSKEAKKRLISGEKDLTISVADDLVKESGQGVTRGDLFRDFLKSKVRERLAEQGRPIAILRDTSKPQAPIKIDLPKSTPKKLPSIDPNVPRFSFTLDKVKQSTRNTGAAGATGSKRRSLLLDEPLKEIKIETISLSKPSPKVKSAQTSRNRNRGLFAANIKTKPLTLPKALSRQDTRTTQSFNLRTSEVDLFNFETINRPRGRSTTRTRFRGLSLPATLTRDLTKTPGLTRTDLLPRSSKKSIIRSSRDRRKSKKGRRGSSFGDDFALVEGFTARALKLKPLKIKTSQLRRTTKRFQTSGIRPRPLIVR